MAANLGIALQMTFIGMGLVFGAILLLWGAMALLVRVLPERAEAAAPAAPSVPKVVAPMADTKHDSTCAAVAAVAVTLALEAAASGQHFPAPPTATVSAWQAVMRGRQLKEQRGPIR
jgi:Na+-transporting methylmalonyl-CoA/oxaloacetate decarboxylase gamma subunit